MARMIKKDGIQDVRERARIEEVVSQYVTLRPAGVGSLKGLCPFHDEKTPSFHVRPQVGQWHCFGCSEGGDVISFVMKINSLPFVEAVEMLAEKAGVQLQYDDDSPTRPASEPGKRQRLIEANKAAEAFFRAQLESDEASTGRKFLTERGFAASDAAHFGIGYAPKGWDGLLKQLRGKGFTDAELAAAGLTSQGQRGVYDRFRGRLIWPIRDLTGATVGFGARKLYEDDPGPKYLNTPETVLYKKSQVLYGLDLARKPIAQNRQVVVVEGYTDVMAMHLAGIETAVASCGTAFGVDHIRVVRRLLGDVADGVSGLAFSAQVSKGGEVVFTFDGDAAGQKAALKAFDEDQRFAAQTFVAVEPGGLDPCDLRITKGDSALRALVEAREPLFEFAIRTALAQFDLSTAEGRIGGLRAAAPVVAGIRDRALRHEYSRSLSGWLGMDEESVRKAVVGGARNAGPGEGQAATGDQARANDGSLRRPAGQVDPVERIERQALEVALQLPSVALAAGFDELPISTFLIPAHRAVHEAIVAAGGCAAAEAGASSWLEELRSNAAAAVASFISGLAVAPLPADSEDESEAYANGIMVSLIKTVLNRRIADTRGRLQRAPEGSEEAQALFESLVGLESQRRSLEA